MSSNVRIDVSALSDTLAKEIANYSQEVTDALKEDVKKVSAECVEEIKTNAPRRTGKYAKSWNYKIAFENDYDIRTVIYCKAPHYRLAHLLEWGHEVIQGGKVIGHVEGHPHIRPAEQHAEEKLMGKIKTRIKIRD